MRAHRWYSISHSVQAAVWTLAISHTVWCHWLRFLHIIAALNTHTLIQTGTHVYRHKECRGHSMWKPTICFPDKLCTSHAVKLLSDRSQSQACVHTLTSVFTFTCIYEEELIWSTPTLCLNCYLFNLYYDYSILITVFCVVPLNIQSGHIAQSVSFHCDEPTVNCPPALLIKNEQSNILQQTTVLKSRKAEKLTSILSWCPCVCNVLSFCGVLSTLE